MKFTCEKHILQAAVNAASRAASARSSIPALEGLLIQAGSGVRVTGYDLRKGIYQNIEAEVEQSGEAVVMTAKLLGEMMRVLPDGMVTVEVGENGKTSIKCGMSEYSFMSLPASDYPELPESDYANAITLEQQKLSEIIDETIFAVSVNESRPVYMGSLFELEGGRLTVVSVDGYRLALRREEVSGSGENARFIVPGSVLQDVSRLCAKSEDPVMIDLAERHVSFSMGGTVVISRLLEGDFLNYHKTIPENFRCPPGRAARGYALRHRPRQPGGGRDGQKPHTPDLRRRRDRLRMQHLPRRGPRRLHVLRRRRRDRDRLQRPLPARRAARRPRRGAERLHQHRHTRSRVGPGRRQRQLCLHGPARQAGKVKKWRELR